MLFVKILCLALVGIFSSIVISAPSSLLLPKETSILDKPLLSPPVRDLGKDLLNNLRDQFISSMVWPGNLVNDDCKSWFEKEGYGLGHIETFNGTYGDVSAIFLEP